MKKIFTVIFTAVLSIATMNDSVQPAVADTHEKRDNVLIAYFSRTGENYGVGMIEKGNTELLAEIIADETGGTLFEIEPVMPYPTGYEDCKEVATKERSENARPEIKNEITDFSRYDVVFLGYPVWWGDMPMISYSFLESYDFSGKTVIPFNTHEGSGQSGTVSSIRKEIPNANVLDGFAVRGSVAQNNGESARSVVRNWLDSNDFDTLANKALPPYTLQDLRNLQDFLLAKPTEESLTGKPYDLNGDNRWDVFDLCLMRHAYLENN